MSRMFDAVLRGKGDVSETMRSVLGDSPSDMIPPAEPVVTAIPYAPPPLPPVQDAPSEIGFGVRTLPLMVASRSPLLIFDQSHCDAAEQYRLVRTRLLQHPRKPKMILVSSPEPRDGKSVTALNLAAALSLKAGSNVLLVEGDLRRPVLADQLGLPRSPGLAEVLEGIVPFEKAVIRAQQYPNLHLLVGGEAGENPSELLERPEWQDNCNAWRSQFSYVILDSPPIGVVADYHVLQASCDGVILVIRPDHTKRNAAFRSIELVPKDRFLGVLLNGVKDWFLVKPHRYESAYYYAGKYPER